MRLGENSEFYVQWRQRFNQAFVDTKFIELWSDGTTHPQGGIKQIIVGTGNTPTRIYNSCEALEVVVTTYYQSRIPDLVQLVYRIGLAWAVRRFLRTAAGRRLSTAKRNVSLLHV